MTQNFFNTIELAGSELKQAEEEAGSQNDQVLRIYQEHADQLLPPTEVHRLYANWNTPLSSIRRSITTLTKLGYLVKTSEMRPGWYGRDNHCWKLK